MAYLTTKLCLTCGENYSGNGQTFDSMCPKCHNAEDASAMSAYFAELDKFSLEERIHKIEEWMYHHRKTKHGYIPPPTY